MAQRSSNYSIPLNNLCKDDSESVKIWPAREMAISMPVENAKLHRAARDGDLAELKKILRGGTDKLRHQSGEGWTPLHFACKHGRLPVIQYIIDRIVTSKNSKVSHVNLPDVWGQTALHIAAMEGNVEMARLLIKNEKAHNKADVKLRTNWGDTPLRAAVRHGQAEMMEFLMDETPKDPFLLHLACLHGQSECVRLLIGSLGAKVCLISNLASAEDIVTDEKLSSGEFNEKDFKVIQENISPIDLAIHYGHRLVVEALIDSSNLMRMMEHAQMVDGIPTTPLRELIRKMPDLAMRVFDHPGSEKLLDDAEYVSDWIPGSNKEVSLASPSNHPLQIMVKEKREQLLGHKLVNSVVQRKWRKYGLPVFIFSVVSQLVFLALITTFSLTVPSPDNFNASLVKNRTECKLQKDAISSIQSPVLKTALIVLMLLIILGSVIMEVVHFAYSRRDYLGLDKLFIWTCYVFTLLFIIPFGPCPGLTKPWQWEFGAWAVVLAWINMLWVLQRNKHFGLYVVMFLRILKTFIKVFFAFLWALVGFALAFAMLFGEQDSFKTFWHSLVTTLVKMTGEFDFGDFFYADEVEVNYKPASYTIFIFFLILAFIIFMNLLVALAIGDIREELEKANLTKKAMQVELSLKVEYFLPDRMPWIDFSELPCFSSMSGSESAVMEPPQYDIETVVKEQQELKREMRMLTNQLMQLQTQLNQNPQ